MVRPTDMPLRRVISYPRALIARTASLTSASALQVAQKIAGAGTRGPRAAPGPADQVVRVQAETGRHRAAPLLRPGYPVAIATLMVVVSFATSLGYSHFLTQPVNDRASIIIEDALPGIEHLSAARIDLTRTGADVSEYVAAARSGKGIRRQDVSANRRQLEKELRAYRRLPSSPEESEQLPGLEGDLALLDEAMNQVLDATDAGSFDAAERTLRNSFRPRLANTHAAIEHLQKLNESQTRTSADYILRARRHAAEVAMLLGIASLAITMIATFLVLRVLRGRARLMQEYARILAERGTELEAFAGRVAHDLKDPLNVVALQVLAAGSRGDLEPKLRDHLKKVARQLERMNQIIEGLLEFACAGANPARGAHADLEQILAEAVSAVRPIAEAANADLRIAAFSPTRLACTPGALSSVLSNLLGNAAKYVAEGRLSPRRITVHVRDRDDVVRVEVEDNGPGLPAGGEQRVFEPFLRLNESKQAGIGLGLATVKKIVEAYQGRVGVDSELGKGSNFWFEIPKAPGDVP